MARVEALSIQAQVPVKLDLHLTVDGSNFDDVGDLYRHFDLPAVPAGGGSAAPQNAEVFDEELWQQRLKFIAEELRELKTAWRAGDLVGVADGVIDLGVVLMGTAHMLGLPWQELWDEVQRSNMEKVRVPGMDHEYHRGVSKPEGWRPPDLASILQRHGFALTWEVE